MERSKENIIIGSKYGDWTILQDLGTRIVGKFFDKILKRYRPSYQRYYLVKCTCGNEKEVRQGDLRLGKTKKCQICAKTGLIHGMRHTPEYRAWQALKDRCTNSKDVSYKNYGGRGIKVCDQWLDKEKGFINFYADMGPRTSPKHSIDRINNDGNYEPGNCRWATRTEQNNNTRRNKKAA
jgi:hypothetical protein